MTVHIDRSRPEQAVVRFSLAAADHPGIVSVVGNFNDWTAGLDELESQPDGVRAVSVGLSYGQTIVFRYLHDDGKWFDEPDADAIRPDGSILTLPSYVAPE